MTNTPNLVALDTPSSLRNFSRRERGDQIGSPKMTVEEEDTIMPMKLVMANPTGIVNNCDHNASLGFLAKRLKSGSFTMSVAKLAICIEGEKVSKCHEWKGQNVKWPFPQACGCALPLDRAIHSSVTYRTHDTLDHCPCKWASGEGGALLNDWTNSMGSDDGPDEEGDGGDGHDDSLDGEQMSDLVDGEIQERERSEPEQEEADEVASVGAGRLRHRVVRAVWSVRIPRRPDGADHQVHTSASNPGLNTVPDTGHAGAVENWPQATPDTEGAARDHGERDVVLCSDTTSEADEATCDGVADPDAEPGLPPAETTDDVGGGNHPGVDVRAVTDPEGTVRLSVTFSVWR